MKNYIISFTLIAAWFSFSSHAGSSWCSSGGPAQVRSHPASHHVAFSDGALNREEQAVLSLVSKGIEAQRDLERTQADGTPIHPFLPMSTSSTHYVRTFKALADSLGRLPTAQTHAQFFVEYARLLLTIIESFSTDANWNRVSTAITIPGSASERGYSAARDFSGEKYEAIKGQLGLSHDPEYATRHTLTRAAQQRFFRAEIDQVESEKRGHYEWFVLFSQRVICSALPDYIHKRLGYLPLNTGFTEYGALIAHWRLWTSETIFKRFQEIIGDDITLKVRTPLALTRAFPRLIMIPYPFQLNEQDLIQFTPIYPVRATNVAPLGFPYVSEKGDGDFIYAPDIFNLHDAHHIAIDRVGQASFESNSPTPLTMEKIEQMHGYIKKLQSLYAQAIDRFQKFLFEEGKEAPLPRTDVPAFYYHMLFEFLHEGSHGLKVRLDALADPRYFLYAELHEQFGYAEARRFFSDDEFKNPKECILRHERRFKEFARDVLGIALYSLILGNRFPPIESMGFPSFGRYTFDIESPRAISAAAIEKGAPIPIMTLAPESMDRYTSSKEIFYYFFTDIEEDTFDPKKTWAIRFKEKAESTVESKDERK
jgi:hypothetical protein